MRPHPFDPLSFLLGISFVVIGGGTLLGDVIPPEVWGAVTSRWVGPAAAIALGLVFLATAASRARQARRQRNGDAAAS